MKKNQLGFGVIELLLLIIALTLVAGVAYYVYKTNFKTKTTQNNAAVIKSNKSPTVTTKTPTPASVDPYAGWKTYENTRYHYSFKYPADFELKATTREGSTPAGSNSSTISSEQNVEIFTPSVHFSVFMDNQNIVLTATSAINVLYGGSSANPGIEPFALNGVNGYKTKKSNGYKELAYALQKNGDPVIYEVITDTSDLSSKILQTFQIN